MIARQQARLTQLTTCPRRAEILQSSAAAQLAELLKDTGVVGPAADLDVDLMSLLPEEAAAYIFQIDQTRGLTRTAVAPEGRVPALRFNRGT